MPGWSARTLHVPTAVGVIVAPFLPDDVHAPVVVNVTGGGKGCVDQAVAAAHKRKCNIVLAAAGREKLDLGTLPRKKISLIKANGHSYRSVELAIQFLASGKLPMDQVATHTFPLSQAREALEKRSP